MAGQARDAAARVAAGAAQVQARDRRGIARRARDRAQHHELVQAEFAVVPVAAVHVEFLLQVRRGQQFRAGDLLADAGGVLLQLVDEQLPERVPAGFPPGAQFAGGVLDYGGQDMFALRRQAGVVEGGDADFHDGLARKPAVLGVVKSPFDMV